MTVEIKRCLVVTDDAGRQTISYDEDLISRIESLTRPAPDPVRRKRPQKKTPIPVADGYKPTATRPTANPTPDKPRRGRPPKKTPIPVADGYKPTATRPTANPTPDKPRRGRPPKSADAPSPSTALAEVRKAAADANLR